jgi:phage gpG-like protein
MIGTGKGDLAELEQFVGGILQSLKPSERRSLLRTVARSMRKSQMARIAKQRNPDGSGFAPRKPPEKPSVGGYAVKFLYPAGGSGQARMVLMKSWVRQGPLLTGYDVQRGAMRSFFWDRVIKFLPVEQGEENAGAGKVNRGSRLRARAMFRRLRSGRFLKADASANEAWVGFAGRIAAIARIHQQGLFDRPTPRSREVRYAERQLLGLTAQDRAGILDAVMEHLLPE